MLRVLINLLVATELVGFCQAVFRVPLRHDFVKRSRSKDEQKRDVDGTDELYDLAEQYPLHKSANPEKKKLAVQPLKVTVLHCPRKCTRELNLRYRMSL